MPKPSVPASGGARTLILFVISIDFAQLAESLPGPEPLTLRMRSDLVDDKENNKDQQIDKENGEENDKDVATLKEMGGCRCDTRPFKCNSNSLRYRVIGR